MATLFQTTSKRRDKLVILAEIIDIAKTGALKTQIMCKANLSFTQLTEYLQLLTRNNLLAKFAQDGKEIYEPTLKGMDFCEKQRQIIDMINDEPKRNGVKSPPISLVCRTKHFQVIGLSNA